MCNTKYLQVAIASWVIKYQMNIQCFTSSHLTAAQFDLTDPVDEWVGSEANDRMTVDMARSVAIAPT